MNQDTAMKDFETLPAWRFAIDEGKALNIDPGEVVVFTFRSEGEEYIPDNPKHKEAVVFEIVPEDSPVMKKLYVRSAALKRQIARLGKSIIGTKVSLHRRGEGLATQWTLQKVDERIRPDAQEEAESGD